jgi:two-component system, chemotaxis family, protein-glutamate methylesterase/glutaminase
MVVKALVVDDSGFFRRRIVEILNADPGIEVVGTAVNGQEAIEQASRLRPDVITMDIEMPVMDGITAVRRIMARQPMPILMFSSLTFEGAKATLDALDAGAADFLPKRFEDIAKDQDEARRVLCRRVRTLGMRRAREREPASAPPRPAPAPVRTDRAPLRLRDLRAVLIGTSTGGPVALQKVLTALPANFPLPLLLVQHVPASFTPAFAQRLDSLCAIRVREAADGDVLEPGLALPAPGGRQMVL